MRRGLFLKLAVMNIKKHRETYLPYIISNIGCIAFFYIMLFLLASPDTPNIRGGSTVRSLLSIGLVVQAVFSLIFLLYSNSFVMKRRQKEFGLYNILGMEKIHISQMLLTETVITGAVSLAAGISAGIAVSKLALLLLLKLIHIPAKFGFYVTVDGILMCAVMYGIVQALTLIRNLGRIHLSRPAELLMGSSAGEKEPKSKWFMAILGFVCLGAGYYLAVTTDSVLSAFGIFLIAVLLVMAGTYLTFTAGSIILLKLMRRRKSFYYKVQNFTSVSGMLYRMKQNAVGLASICILSTGVLLMLSSTVCLNAGIDQTVKASWPFDLNVNLYGYSLEEAYRAGEYVIQKTSEEKFPVQDMEESISLPMIAVQNGESLEIISSDSVISTSEFLGLTLVPEKAYEKKFSEAVELKDGEVLIYGKEFKKISLMGEEFSVCGRLDEEPLGGNFVLNELGDTLYLVMTDGDFERINQRQKEYTDFPYTVRTEIGINIEGSDALKTSCSDALDKVLKEYVESRQISEGGYYTNKSQIQAKNGLYDTNGGLLFLGVLLGGAFLMGTALIIYYKQISEGYEDRSRFEIMRKVGMSRREVKSSISRQILMVFFLPLLMAVLHISMAFPLIQKLLQALGMPPGRLFLICTAATVLIFALVYGVIYIFTARSYYKILEKAE